MSDLARGENEGMRSVLITCCVFSGTASHFREIENMMKKKRREVNVSDWIHSSHRCCNNMTHVCARHIRTDHKFGFSIQSAVEAAKCRLSPTDTPGFILQCPNVFLHAPWEAPFLVKTLRSLLSRARHERAMKPFMASCGRPEGHYETVFKLLHVKLLTLLLSHRICQKNKTKII